MIAKPVKAIAASESLPGLLSLSVNGCLFDIQTKRDTLGRAQIDRLHRQLSLLPHYCLDEAFSNRVLQRIGARIDRTVTTPMMTEPAISAASSIQSASSLYIQGGMEDVSFAASSW